MKRILVSIMVLVSVCAYAHEMPIGRHVVQATRACIQGSTGGITNHKDMEIVIEGGHFYLTADHYVIALFTIQRDVTDSDECKAYMCIEPKHAQDVLVTYTTKQINDIITLHTVVVSWSKDYIEEFNFITK